MPSRTRQVVGCVVGVGAETKIMLNQKTTRAKVSRVEQRMNRVVKLILAIELTVTLGFGRAVALRSVQPLYTRLVQIFGCSIAELPTRPHPR
jgi:magnesium-transporting ATPase (P-type)